jgi:hypothetical protein
MRAAWALTVVAAFVGGVWTGGKVAFGLVRGREYEAEFDRLVQEGAFG